MIVDYSHLVQSNSPGVDDVKVSGLHGACAGYAVGRAMSAREALEIATLGGAGVLGRDDLGSIEPGKRADLAVWDMRGVEAAGAWDPVAALVLCGPTRVRHLVVEGRQVVRDGQIVTLDLTSILERQRRLAARLAG